MFFALTCVAFSEDFMSRTACYTSYPQDHAILSACHSVFYWNEDVFGIRWAEDMFKLDAEAKDTKVHFAGDNDGYAGYAESNKTISNVPNKESNESFADNSSEGSRYQQ